MSEEISIIKLRDGSTIVGKINWDEDFIEIEHPIELVSSISPLQGVLGEQISLRPWMAIAQENTFVVERNNIITIGLLDDAFISGYERMVDTIYFQEAKWQGTLMDENQKLESIQRGLDKLEEEFDSETITELAEAVMKNQIH